METPMRAKRVAAACAALLSADALWIWLNSKSYLDAAAAVQGTPVRNVAAYAVVAAYVCLLALLVCFALPLVDTNPWRLRYPAASYGWLLGLLVYGVYNGTTLALFARYPWTLAVKDTVWGGVLVALACVAGSLV